MTPRLHGVLGPGVQIWERERLVNHWRLEPALLGWEQTGTDMDDDIAACLPLPAKDHVLDYTRLAFAAAERAVEAIEDQEFSIPHQVPYEREPRPIGSFVVSYHAHDERHLGQIIGLRRAMGFSRLLA